MSADNPKLDTRYRAFHFCPDKGLLLSADIQLVVNDVVLEMEPVFSAMSIIHEHLVFELSFGIRYIINILPPVQPESGLLQGHLDSIKGESRIKIYEGATIMIHLGALRRPDAKRGP